MDLSSMENFWSMLISRVVKKLFRIKPKACSLDVTWWQAFSLLVLVEVCEYFSFYALWNFVD